jgi:hypothetical protein
MALDARFPFNLDLELAYHVLWLLGQDNGRATHLAAKVSTAFKSFKSDTALHDINQSRLKSRYKDCW